MYVSVKHWLRSLDDYGGAGKPTEPHNSENSQKADMYNKSSTALHTRQDTQGR